MSGIKKRGGRTVIYIIVETTILMNKICRMISLINQIMIQNALWKLRWIYRLQSIVCPRVAFAHISYIFVLLF